MCVVCARACVVNVLLAGTSVRLIPTLTLLGHTGFLHHMLSQAPPPPLPIAYSCALNPAPPSHAHAPLGRRCFGARLASPA